MTVEDAEPVVVGEGHDPVTDRESAAVDVEFVGSDDPVGLEGGAGVLVEGGDVVVGGGEHERTVTVEGLVEPLGDHLGPCGGFGGMVVDAAVRGEDPERVGGVTVAEFGERAAFDRVAVPPIFGEVDRAGSAGEGGEHAAGFDRGELVVVTDKDDFRVGPIGVA